MDVMSNLGQSAKGMFSSNVGEKAILYIYLVNLNSKKTITLDEAKQMLKTETDALNKLQKDLMGKTKGKLSASGIAKSIGSSIADSAAGTFKKGVNSADHIADLDLGHPSFVKFYVQYNPASIRLYSVNGKVQARKDEAGIDKLDVYNFSGKSKLSFDLIFDDCDNMNAFALNEVANVNVTSALNKGLSALQHGGLNYSVRKKMDAIMSLLSSSATQQVVFFWANMAFRGTITDVGNRFTMFNPAGNPIRGEMHLELTQDKKSTELAYDETYWDNAFEKCFKKKDALGAIAGGVSTASKALNNNFINLNL